MLPASSDYARFWSIDPSVVYLNHGSFGACPDHILEKQTEYRSRLEREPIRWLVKEMEPLHVRAREKAAAFVNANPDDVVFVNNATAAVNVVFRSIHFCPGDEILFTNHIYGACRRLLEYIASQTGAVLVETIIPFPVQSSEVITNAILEKITPRTRIALIDHISSATALVHPVDQIVRELESRGIDTMIDGAHALGCIPLDLERTGAAYYTTNCHKWLCAPKSAAILHVRKDRQAGLQPSVISHAGHLAEPFAERFFWPGTTDPTAILCVPDALDYMGSLLPGGWPELMKRNHDLCLDARKMLCDALEIDPPCPEEMIASMATLPLPLPEICTPPDYKSFDVLQERLFEAFHIEIPVWYWDTPPSRLTRISVQLYNSMEQFRYLSESLIKMLND